MPDLDAYAEPRRDAATLAARREALLDQLGWLEDEAAALAPLLAALPAWATDQAPMPNDRTAKETFAAFAALDREVTPRWLERIASEDAPALETPDLEDALEGANDRDLDDLLADVRAARADLRAAFEAVPAVAWSRKAVLPSDGALDGATTDLYGVALHVVRRDAEWLKELAYRLHEADLRPRTPEDDLPRPS